MTARLTVDSITLVLTFGEQQLWTTFSPRDANEKRLNIDAFMAKLAEIAKTFSATDWSAEQSVIIPITEHLKPKTNGAENE
jgi:hypothetical protein